MSVYISPPFGNYVKYDRCVRIRGTYTWERRTGLFKQIARTLRKVPGGWINKIGFRNCGVENLKKCDKTAVYSIAALDSDWSPFIENPPSWSKLEINIGCPNVGSYVITDDEVKRFVDRFPMLQVKFSPTAYTPDAVSKMYNLGVKVFHLSNTIPTDRGGISGRQLKEVNLPLVEKIANMDLKGSAIIAGGGIYTPQDVRDYKNAGVTSYSLSTIWFTPWKVPAVYQETLR